MKPSEAGPPRCPRFPSLVLSQGKGVFIMPTVLDWRDTGSVGPPAPCVICKRPAVCRSPKGTVVHKVCAERWLDACDRSDGGRGWAA